MAKLLPIRKIKDVPKPYQKTPVSDLLLYHNGRLPHRTYKKARLLIAMCMDNRKKLNIPENFAFIIRTGGANLRYSEFKVAYAIGVGGVEFIALIGHTQCGMVGLKTRKNKFIKGMCDRAGWDAEKAENYFDQYAPMFEIPNKIDFMLSETRRLSGIFPKIKIVPLLYKMKDRRLYWIDRNG